MKWGCENQQSFLQEAAMFLLLNNEVPVIVEQVEQETERNVSEVVSIR